MTQPDRTTDGRKRITRTTAMNLPRSEPFTRMLLLFFGLALGFSPAQAAESPSSVAAKRNELRVGMPFFPSLNPLLEATEQSFMLSAQLFAAPLRFDAEGNAAPYLAERWSISDDGRTIELKLIEGAVFHDGVPITAEDVAFSLLALRDHNPNRELYQAIETVETPNPGAAIIHLNRPHPAPELMLATPLAPILPKHIYGDGQPLANHPANSAPVGSGPFKWVPGTPPDRIELVRHDDYFRPGLPRLDRLIIYRHERGDSGYLMLEHDEIQLLPFAYAGSTTFDRLLKDPDIVIAPGVNPTATLMSSIVFNLEKAPLSDLRVRQAFAMGIDYQRIVSALSRGSDMPTHLLIPQTSPMYTPLPPPFKFDQKRANALLDEAGYLKNERGIRFKIVMDYPPFSEIMKVTDALRYEVRRNLGIDLEVHHSADFQEWGGRLLSRKFDLTYWIMFSFRDPLLGFHRAYRPNTGEKPQLFANQSGLRSPELERLLDQAATEPKPTRRRELYAEIQRLIFEQLPVVSSSSINLPHAYRKGLLGLNNTPWTTMAPFDELHWAAQP